MKHQTLILFLFLNLLSLISCARKELNKEDDTVDEAQVHHLKEERQRVIRYDCQNAVVSDRVETVAAPIEHLSIKPTSSSQLFSSEFKNLTLNTLAGSISNYTDFTIDLNPGALNLEVKIGLNQIQYKFYYCNKLILPPEDHRCQTTPELRETGSIYINVSYEKIDLPGEQVIKPTPEQCAHRALPTKNN